MKLTLKRKKINSSAGAVSELHWLPVKYRIKFKIVVIVHKCLEGLAPHYLQDLCVNNYKHDLRNNSRRLIVPDVKNETFAARVFSVTGPKLWNSLPQYIRTELNFEVFKSKLKTHYYVEAFQLNSDFIYY